MRPILVLILATFSLSHAWVPAWARASAAPVCQAMHVDQEPRLDGLLDEPVWSLAKPIGDFIQREPHNGEAASERTEVRVVHSSRTLFIGARLYDRHASRIIATVYQRDGELTADDTAGHNPR